MQTGKVSQRDQVSMQQACFAAAAACLGTVGFHTTEQMPGSAAILLVFSNRRNGKKCALQKINRK